ncbi:hypothetical protein V5F79_00170 [Xanthobacter flavus]|uniref:SMODS domain-containing nucleotidyltransferase n=1 Tax=Xanthobacter flavus TaxID=281 RepID=UPI00372A4893
MWIGVIPRFWTFQNELLLTADHIEDGQTKTRGVFGSLQRAYWPDRAGDPPGFWVGSWGKGTQVRPPSDVDVMFELPVETFQRFQSRAGNVQSALLQEVKGVLLETYRTSDIRGDGQVAQVRFNSLMVEVVPVFRLTTGQFYMPDTNDGGRWKAVDPVAEQQQIQRLDQECNGNIRRMCRIMKVWKREQNVPLKSFQIELLMQEFMEKYQYRTYGYYFYDWFVRDFLAYLISRANTTLWVPGTFEAIPLGSAWLSKAQTAYQCALSACDLERSDYVISAGLEWQKMFGTRIPTGPF